jgi:hypothetical protein
VEPFLLQSRALPGGMTAAVVAAGVLVAGALALWTYYGTAVFYEMVLAGIAACF